MPETLLESELFGHVKGDFTGATANKMGLFEAASGGSLMLDEIGDLPMSIQGKILRVLQDGEVRRVGSNESRKVDVRIIAATNVNLEEAQKAGKFREDLYYRLNVIPIAVPALRERSEDVPVLAHHFLRRMALREKKQLKGFTREAIAALSSYRWPGNVRELENVVERAVVMCREEVIGVDLLSDHLVGTSTSSEPVGLGALSRMPFAEAKQLANEAFERRYLEAVLQRTDGNVSEAARESGMDRSNFRRVLKRYDLRT
jgi:two-component system response regulator HydG